MVGVAVSVGVPLPPGVHVYVDKLPPVAATANCVLPPEQTEAGKAVAVMEDGDISRSTITDCVVTQLLASVMEAMYVPPARLLMVLVVCTGVVFHASE